MATIENLAERDDLPPEGSLWRHQSGNIYRVESVGYFEPTLEVVVIYRQHPAYDGFPWVRPLSVFQQRFARID